MSDSQNAGFGKFIPGFDFLQNLSKGAGDALPHMPNMSSWIAPSLNVEELDKRISELKTVHFWLDQNSKALAATVQALEVQKMTLATLKGMNVHIGDLASVFAPKPAAEQAAPATAAPTAAPTAAATAAPEAPAAGEAAPAMVDPMKLWGALTQQFQTIAATALKDVNASAALNAVKKAATQAATTKTAAPAPTKTAAKAPAKTATKTAAKKVAAKPSGRSTR